VSLFWGTISSLTDEGRKAGHCGKSQKVACRGRKGNQMTNFGIVAQASSVEFGAPHNAEESSGDRGLVKTETREEEVD